MADELGLGLVWSNHATVIEKAIYIHLVSTIFQLATQVVAWLVPENQSRNGEVVIENLKSVTSFARESESTFLDSMRPKNDSRGSDIDTWTDLDAFLDRPWFKRVWIVQELVLPTKVTVVCGRSAIDWDGFFEVIQPCERGLNAGGHQLEDALIL
ncbi:hypothetical protein CEP51_012855 [Fusarium floridanum]|uniref:Heterokaryon incompatibility domain-containing protein n=1 Tax=Fusarium floridanum TaxID=1325733 RepID=A0A428QLP8_9HYPO|nr:hypothetical protein CEP51_012855 [Fusarium floridanum]